VVVALIGISSFAQVLVHVDVLMTCTTLKNTLTSLDDFGTSFFGAQLFDREPESTRTKDALPAP
jgi:hypothetical protein